MKKSKRAYVVSILILLCVGLVLYIITWKKKETKPIADDEASKKENWMYFDPIDFDMDDVLSITYIKDRSGLGEKTNLSWHIDDETGIQALIDCIKQDTSYLGYFDQKDNPDGNTVIVLWFELADGTAENLIYTDTWLTYDDIAYRIISREGLLKNAHMSILKDYKQTETSGTDNPYG